MNTFILVWGVRVSGYTVFSSVEFLEGQGIDNAINRKYGDVGLPKEAVILALYRLDPEDSEITPVRYI